MDRLIAQGKITYVGSSNFPGWSIAQANERAAASNRLGIVSEQSLYNLIERRAELEVIPACIAYGVGLIIWSPLAGGLLAGASNAADGRRQSAEMQQQLEQRSEQLQAFAALAAEIGQTPANVALAWLLHQPGVVSTIVGPGSTDQMTSMLDVPEIALDAQLLAHLDELFPPCGPAPEAYAW
ncbi:MAG: aldo/keto reductase [Pseudomonadales bacterium]